MPSVFSALSPIKHSPPAAAETFAAASSKAKEHDASKARTSRKPLGPRKQSPPTTPRRSRKENDENAPASVEKRGKRSHKADSSTVTERMREWERERREGVADDPATV